MLKPAIRTTALLLSLGVLACAPTNPGAGPAVATPVPAVAQQASPTPASAVATPTAGRPACLDNPNYATMPLPPRGNRGRAAQWLARPDGSCHWTRNAV